MTVASSNRKRKQHKKSKASKAVVLTQSARPAKPLFRLIPATVTMAVALLGLKSIEIYQSGRAIHQELFVSSAIAEAPAPKEAEEQEVASAETTAETPAEAAATAETPPAAPAAPVDIVEQKAGQINPREADVLESLAERRKKLDQWENDIALREKVLQATEQRIDQKLGELNAMSGELKEMLVTYDEEEDAKVSSLVKVYEAMKPKDAARIFDELDMDILLMVVDRMSERKVAPVLAAMSPQKARDLTQLLADQKKAKPAMLDEEAGNTPYNPPLF